MSEFLTSIDIANRALQHCGASRLSATLGFTEVSKNAAETRFAYGKLRRAELQENVWTFATRRVPLRAIDETTMLLAASMWVAGTTYFIGSIVADASGTLWISRVPNNLGNDPQNSLTWEPYYGPLSVSLYDEDTPYSSGELVYTTPGDGTNRVYLSLQNGNSDAPGTATDYDATVTYMKNQVVTYLSVAYMSLIDLNIGNTPSAAPALWSDATTYGIGESVGASDGVIYTSITAGNLDHDPVLDGGVNWTNTGVLNPWTTVFVGGTGSLNWLQIGGSEFPNGVTLSALKIIYPIGAGPSTQSDTRNLFRLPSGYLRMAPQNPKATTPALGGPSGYTYNDWNFDGDFLVTVETGPIAFRCVVDVTDVTKMNDMFCEGLAARIALAVCETLTQSSAKLATITRIYSQFMGRAKTQNAIEQGYDDPPDDDYLTVRN